MQHSGDPTWAGPLRGIRVLDFTHELAGPESVEDLLLLLLMESDTPRHPAH